mgnify:CR=1 FL=1
MIRLIKNIWLRFKSWIEYKKKIKKIKKRDPFIYK